jgi:hypothetical protein
MSFALTHTLPTAQTPKRTCRFSEVVLATRWRITELRAPASILIRNAWLPPLRSSLRPLKSTSWKWLAPPLPCAMPLSSPRSHCPVRHAATQPERGFQSEPGQMDCSCAAGFDRYWRSLGRH